MEMLRVDSSLEYFSVGQRYGDRVLGVRLGLEYLVRPKFDVVGDGVNSSHGYLVRGGGARVDGLAGNGVFVGPSLSE